MEKISQLLMCVLTLFMVGCTGSNATSANEHGAAAKLAPNPTATPPQSQAPTNPEDKIPRVKAPDAMKEVSAGTSVIVDVRGADAYKTEHIKGALDIPLQKLESKDFSGVPKDKRIIAYCT